MDWSTIPAEGISLHGPGEDAGELRQGMSSGLLLRLGEDVLEELKGNEDGLRFVTGNTPKLRIGGRTIDLSISEDAFRNELYASTTAASTTDFTFTSILSHRAELKLEKQYGADTGGTDAALATLQNNLAAYKKEKEANQTQMSNEIVDVPKGRRDAVRKEKLDKRKRLLDSRQGSQPPSPSLSAMGTPRVGPAPTSAPPTEDELRLKAMKKALVHLLAIGPTSREEVKRRTHIPRDDLDVILQKVGKQVDGKWQLNDKAHKELDVWSFGYPSPDDRQSAVDNAIRAYDRLRLGKEDNLWQLLLPKEERGTGKVLSRLHLNGAVGGVQKNSLASHQPSPAHVNSGDDKVGSSANTPRLGASTPRPTSSKGDVMKRLLSKNPEKAHKLEEAKMKKSKAAEEAREKKRKEKEEAAAASDKEGGRPKKRQATNKEKSNSKIKSADIVHSSEDESGEDGEVKEGPVKPPPAAAEKKNPPTNNTTTVKHTTSPDESSDSAKPIKQAKKTAPKPKPTANAAKASTSASPAVKATKAAPDIAGKSTPQPATNGLSAPSSQHKARSPSAVGSRPGVPSPLGAARPRVASDVSDRSAVGVQRVRQQGQGKGGETPRGLGITNGGGNGSAVGVGNGNGVRKRTDTVTSKSGNGAGAGAGSGTPDAGGETKAKVKDKDKDKDKKAEGEAGKPAVNGVAGAKGAAKTNGAATATKPETGTKRKAPSTQETAHNSDTANNSNKHRKTTSTSSLSQTTTNSTTLSSSTSNPIHSPTTTTSPSSSSNNDAALLDTISYKTGVSQAAKFREHFYPAYVALYDEIEGMQARGERVEVEKVEQLRKWHRRLVEMKREIEAASRRGVGE